MGSRVEETEVTLVRRARRGDRDAFALLAGLYYPRVYRVAIRFARNEEDAAEITQDAFMRAMKSMHMFDAKRQLFPWLYQITRNLSLNRIERVRKRETGLPEYELEDARSTGPEDELLRESRAQAVRDAIESLPEQHRTIIRLSHYDECSYQEMAEILGIPVGTVMSRLYNARKKLREALAREEE